MYVRFCTIACLALALGACASVPMSAITSNGHVFRGTFKPGIPSEFQISDGHVTCAGQLRNYTVVMDCNHGLKGIVSFKKDTESAFSGGTLRLSDGTAGTFILGDDAAKL